MTTYLKFKWALQYAKLTIRHKFFVFQAGRKLKVSLWRLIKHDYSKFLPSEIFFYGRQFFGDKGDPRGFARAWLRHQNKHEHHWEFWIPRTSHNRLDPTMGDDKPLPMTEEAVREMIADWLGAGRAYEGRWPSSTDWKWWTANKQRILTRLHPETKILTELIIQRDLKMSS